MNWFLVGLAAIGGIAVLFAVMLMWWSLRRGIREEIRAWKLRTRYRPAPPSQAYKVINVGEPE